MADDHTNATGASRPPVALSIAGFDPSSGAGVTADLQVFAAHGLFGTSVITALTSQSTRGVRGVRPTPVEFFTESLQELTTDMPPAGVKIGMLGNRSLAIATLGFLTALNDSEAGKVHTPCVLDPIVASSSGMSLLASEDLSVLFRSILPLVDWVTPNRNELSLLTAVPASTESEALRAIAILASHHTALNIVVTGGDLDESRDIVHLASGDQEILTGPHMVSRSTHGTGCAFSSALLAGLINGLAAMDAAKAAKRYVRQAILTAPGLGSGFGPLNLLWPLAQKGTDTL